MSAGTAGRRFEQELRHRTAMLAAALDELGPVRRSEQNGVWTVTGQAAVTDRVTGFVGTAEEEGVYMTVEDPLTDALVDALGDADARGVDIRPGGVSPAVQRELRDAIPEAELFESLWVWTDTPAARLVMGDWRRTLVSVFADGAAAGDDVAETAIRGVGEQNSLVVVKRAMVAWRLDDR